MCVPKYLTQVYAIPAHKAPNNAANAPILIILFPLGLIINVIPIKAIIIEKTWNLVISSLKNMYDNIIIIKGDSFWIIEESAKLIWEIA